jgi:pimeloyl-ACP methyl ester carboxylesterase
MKYLIFTLLIICTSYICPAQTRNIDGAWLGTLDVGMQLRLVFHFEKDAQQNYSAKIDSPDQGVNGIPTTSVYVVADSVRIMMDAINSKFEGVLLNDTTLAGSWSQGPATIPLTLKKVNELPTVNRPQTPLPPFPYTVEDVEFDNADKSVHLAGTITYPSAGGPFAAAILISGSGQQDRDETIAGHKPFAVIADHLTKQGMAILRLDDRGTGKSTGEVEKATSADFANDIETAIQYLSGHPAIDKNKIGLIGHSEGGLIASIIASRNKNIEFMILLAGPGTKGSVLLADQVEAIMQASNVPGPSAKAFKTLYSQVIHHSLTAKDTAAAITAAISTYYSWKKNAPGTVLTDLGITTDKIDEENIRTMVREFSKPWMKYFLQSDPVPYLQNTNAKVLALNGEKDVQVLPQPNLAGITAALQKSKSPVYEVKEMEGLNHLFQTCRQCTPAEYGMLEETFSPMALQAMSEWLKKNVMQ